ncbi:MAG: hypothetical protein QW728_03285, partial [Thermoplasmata archaeon]
PKTEEDTIAYAPSSGLSNPEHPMRPKEGFQPRWEPIKIDEGKDKGKGAKSFLKKSEVAEEVAVESTPPTMIDSVTAAVPDEKENKKNTGAGAKKEAKELKEKEPAKEPKENKENRDNKEAKK